MTKQKQVTINLDVYTAAAVRQVLFDAQKGYGFQHTPERILNIRSVISNIDTKLESIIGG
jgi:hypothetical protein